MQKDDQQPKNGAPQGEADGLESQKDAIRHDVERIRELRERLYSREGKPVRSMRHALPPHEARHENGQLQRKEESVSKEAPVPQKAEVQVPEQEPEQSAVLYSDPMAYQNRRKSYRRKLMLLGIAFFVLALGVSSFFLFSGTNTISGDNISINVSGPISVGGGEDLQFQVSIANQNTVPIQSATLIIEYPKGTHSATEVNKEVFIDRQQLETIGTGELINVPLKARVFGEENEEKEIKVSIDYRIAGSNATFHKVASPFRFKVSTSPIVMTFDSVKSISSGQEFELKLTVQSNSPTPLSDILVKVDYPDGFDFSEANPSTVSGEDTWKLLTLKSAEKKVIVIKGLMTGYENETRKFTATAGVANGTDRNTLVSVLAKAQTEVGIELAFLDVGVTINGSTAETTVINTEESANVEIRYGNALDTTIYDGKVLAELSGNALNEFEVKVTDGFYDSTKNTITWDGVDEESLKEILPGRSSTLSFTLDPKANIKSSPEIKIKITVKGQRVFEDRVPQELVGTTERTIKMESVQNIEASALYSTGPFTNTGPTPPVAEKVTQYTYTMRVKTGTNDVTGAEVTAVIPQYVSWLDLVTDGDDVTYNATTRTMRWTIGDMDANSTEEVSVQVSFLPSLSQVGTTPTILEAQRFKATDRFTGTVVRADHPALTTSLFDERDKDLEDGRVRKD